MTDDARSEADALPGDEAAAGGAAGDGSPAAGSRGRRGRLGFWLRVAFAGLLGFAVTALALLSQTQSGQRMVLDEALGRIRGALAGELAVEGIRSRTLLAGLTLTEVRLDAEGGRPVLAADSVVLRYSPISLLFGTPRVRSTTIHGLELRIAREPGQDHLNVERILAERPPADAAVPERPRTIALGRLAVRGGAITVLTPVEQASGLTVAASDGSPLRRLSFEGVDLDLEETVLRPGGAVSLDARLASFSARVHLVEDPFIVRAAAGDLTFGAEGLRIEDGAFRMTGSLLAGSLGFGPDRPGAPWRFAASLRADEWGDLADLRWIDPRIPAGGFRGGADVHAAAGFDVSLRELEVQLDASTVVATGRARFDDGLVLSEMVVTATPLDIGDLEPWLARELPLDGFLSGRATFSGTAEELHVDGRLTLVPTGMGGAPTRADFSGTVHPGANAGADGLVVRLDPLNYRVLEALWPGASGLGVGSAELEIDGRAEEGLLVVADLSHASETGTVSRAFGRGLFRRGETGEWVTDTRGELAPLALSLLGRLRPGLDLRGSVSGPVRLEGGLRNLRFQGDLGGGGGRLVASGSVDLASIGSSWSLEADAEAVSVTAFTDRVPEPSIVSGHLVAEGSGLLLDSLRGRASVDVRPSRIGAVRVGSAEVVVRAAEGLLTVDTLEAAVSGAHLAGSGTFGMTPAANGEARIVLAIDSMRTLRPMFMGDSILVRDDLSPLEQDLLRVRGIEPDTLPTELDVRLAGSVRGTALVRGGFGDFGVEVSLEMADAAYRHDEVDSASVSLVASGLPEAFGDWAVDAHVQGLTWAARSFEEIDFDGTMSQRRGEGTVEILRRLRERYFLTGAFALDSLGGEVALTEASVQIDDLSWVLSAPTRIAWDTSSVSVDSLELRRLGEDPARLTARGRLTRGGESNFRLDTEGFHVEDATRILQREDLDVSGHIDLNVTVQGPSESPEVDALFQIEDPRYGALELTRLSGSLEYRDQTSELRVDAWDGSRNVLSAVGTLPLDLALADVERRALDEPMDVRVTADSLDARIPLAYLRTLEDVAGAISADLQIGGTSREPAPSGTIRLADGAWTIEALGVRHTGLAGELLLRADRTVGVELRTSESGRSTVSGVVTMIPFFDPTLDLLVTLDGFQAVDRRDIESTLSGEFTVKGPYSLPVAQGALRVDQGTLFVEEFARSAAVVDLRDPTLFADGFAVDTTVFVTQPILASLRNPFLDNLRVDIDLSVPRDLWLRSNEMNVEIGGELLVRYDRRQGDLVMVGDLQALRGSYRVLGRTFEVDGGTVSFLGQPGVNPALDIQALSRIRRREGDRLEVRATVAGTLVQPRVTLSTEEAGLSQSDLVTYLLFGRASGEMGTWATGAGAGLREDLTTGGLTLIAGQLASEVTTAFAQGIGFDYLAVSQGDVLGDDNPAVNFLSTAQFEVGRYFGDDVFVVLVLSRPSGQAATEGVGVNFLRGVRVELALSEEWFVEGFIEDQFLRGSGGLGAAGIDGREVVGALIFREWGYGSRE